MKKILIIGITIFLITSTGCTTNPVLETPSSTASQSDVVSTTSQLSIKREVDPADFLEIQNKLNQGKKIVEAESVPKFQLPPGIFVEQLWRLFKLDDIYFAVYVRQNSNFFGSTMPEGTVQSGILWARKGDRAWHKFFVAQDKSSDDLNNVIYLWNQNDKMQMLVQEPDRSASGAGLGRILNSLDGGKTWKIDRCFFLSVGGTGILPTKRPAKSGLTAFQKYLNDNYIFRKSNNNPLILPDKRDLKFNSSTGKFELDFFDKEQNKIVNQEIDECFDMVLP
jgi:hypothetical protein